VVFYVDFPTANAKGSVQVYDAVTGQRRIIAAGPDASGFIPSRTVEAGGDAALVQMIKPCGAANGACPRYFVLLSLRDVG
jgi:hypothetical protein